MTRHGIAHMSLEQVHLLWFTVSVIQFRRAGNQASSPRHMAAVMRATLLILGSLAYGTCSLQCSGETPRDICALCGLLEEAQGSGGTSVTQVRNSGQQDRKIGAR
ncbi:hypothetical protein ACLKA7_010876 [Drosophila subpalustris]